MHAGLLLFFELATVGLGAPTYTLDASVCRADAGIVRSGPTSMNVQVVGRESGQCVLRHLTSQNTLVECAAKSGLVVVTVEGARGATCEAKKIIDDFSYQPRNLVWKGELLNGLREGTWTGWNYGPFGNEKWVTLEYAQGRKDGEYVCSGCPHERGRYRADKKVGHWIEGSGERLNEGDYVDGLRSGVWIAHYFGHRAAMSEVYRRGMNHGPKIFYSDTGKIRSETVFVDGRMIRDWRLHD